MTLGSENGFSLVELLVTMAITVVVFGATLTVLDVFQKNNGYAQLRNETQDSARTAMDRLARQLRNVSAPTTGSAGALEVEEPNSIVFQTIDPNASESAANKNATRAMRVRYCLDDSNPNNEVLWYQVKKWTTAETPTLPATTTCPDANATDYDSKTVLVAHLTNRIGGKTNRPVFTYSGVGIPTTTSVETNLFLNLTPERSRPGETQLTSGTALRNANRPPTAKFTITKVNEHVRLNASESLNPDGLALTYKWWKDGTELANTSQVYESPGTESPGTHTYKLEIADPSGLASSSEKTEKFP